MKKLFGKFQGNLQHNHPLAGYTSWKIGGLAEYFYQPTDIKDLANFLHNCKHDPIILLGAATNVLIRDSGIKGTVIYLRGSLNELQQLDDFSLRAEAGVSCSRLVQQCIHLSLVDAAFLAGIPGTIGGALAMNAGAYDDSIWTHVTAVETINRRGEIQLRPATEFKPGYRQVTGLDTNEWFVAGHFRFTRGDEKEAEHQVRELMRQRQSTQPLNQPSCGSVFRNPPKDYAARLIESCGFKGKCIGDACVSEKHANFIVNIGAATSAQVEALIQEIIDTVREQHGIELHPEVRILGEL